MPPLHEALVEVHKEYECASRAARDMANLYKQATTTSNVLSEKYTRTQAEKEELLEKCRRIEEKLNKAEEELVACKKPTRTSDSVQELTQKVQDAKASARSATTREE